MNAAPFDTLKMAQRLQAAGFSGPQAGSASEALAEALTGADLATRGDIAAVRTELAGVESRVLAALELLRRDMTIKLGGMIIIAVGILLAGMRFLPPHP